MSDFKRDLQAHADAIEALLLELLPTASGAQTSQVPQTSQVLQARLHDAMRYATLDGGKRLRPFLVAGGARLFDVPEHRALRVGVAIELIHGYSLVHDDLPAMDDAVLRRGRASCHKRFDEATAVLAGDALQSLAFEVLASEATHPDPAVRVELVRLLAIAAGAAGMCRGADDRSRSGNQAARLRADGGAAAAQDRRSLSFCQPRAARYWGAASTPEQAALASLCR